MSYQREIIGDYFILVCPVYTKRELPAVCYVHSIFSRILYAYSHHLQFATMGKAKFL